MFVAIWMTIITLWCISLFLNADKPVQIVYIFFVWILFGWFPVGVFKLFLHLLN